MFPQAGCFALRYLRTLQFVLPYWPPARRHAGNRGGGRRQRSFRDPVRPSLSLSHKVSTAAIWFDPRYEILETFLRSVSSDKPTSSLEAAMRLNSRSLSQPGAPRATSNFIDRVSEAQAFRRTLIAHRRALDSEDWDPAARRNILVYYGTGGIGKTELSKRLRQWASHKLPPGSGDGWGNLETRVDATLGIDLKDLGGRFDLLGTLISLRQELGSLRRSWPAFDLALAAYWSAAFPGRPLQALSTEGHGFPEAVTDLLSNLLTDFGISATPVGVGVHSVRLVLREWRRQEQRRAAFKIYDSYDELLQRCLTEPSPSDPRSDLILELAWLLAVEISAGWDSTPVIVVFIDTFERLLLDARRTGEQLLNQFIWRMPNVLFVLTGRDSLDWWDDRRSTLENSGEDSWPGLSLGQIEEPRQHLVGRLSDVDRRRFIRDGCRALALSMPSSVRDELVHASGGLPLYLDIALDVAVTVKRNENREVTIADVTGSLGSLVDRIFEHMESDERRALRAASLFDFFDVALIAATAGVDHGCAERACMKSMIERIEGFTFPYRMHDEIRDAIRSAGPRSAGGWSDWDWQHAGRNALRELRRRYQSAAEGSAGRETLEAIGLAIGVVCDLEVDIEEPDSGPYADWLTKSIVHGPSISGLRSYVPTRSKTLYGAGVLDFISSRDPELALGERRKMMLQIFNSNHPLSRPAGRHLAYNLRNHGNWDEAIDVFDQLFVISPSEVHAYQRAVTIVLARRFKEALQGIADLPPLRAAGVTGNIEMSHARPDRWFENLPSVQKRQASRGAQREFLETAANAFAWRTLFFDDASEFDGRRLLEQAEEVGHDAAARDAMLGLLLLLGSSEDGMAHLDRLERLDRAVNYGERGYRSTLARLVLAFVEGDGGALRLLSSDVARTPRRGRQWIPIECLLDSLSFPVTVPETQWLEPYDIVRDRWRGIFERLRRRLLA